MNSMEHYLQLKATDRLNIRPLTLDDIPLWSTFLGDPSTTRYFPEAMRAQGAQQARPWIERQIDRYHNGQFGLLALLEKESGNFVGQCGLITQTVDEQEVLEIGYHLLPDYWGKGYATEAARFFRQYAFSRKLADRLVSIIHIDNVPSQRVAERNGMRRGRRTDFRGIPVFIYHTEDPSIPTTR